MFVVACVGMSIGYPLGSVDLSVVFSVLQSLAKELVMSRNAKTRMYEGKAQLHSVQMQLQNQLGTYTPPIKCPSVLEICLAEVAGHDDL